MHGQNNLITFICFMPVNVYYVGELMFNDWIVFSSVGPLKLLLANGGLVKNNG